MPGLHPLLLLHVSLLHLLSLLLMPLLSLLRAGLIGIPLLHLLVFSRLPLVEFLSFFFLSGVHLVLLLLILPVLIRICRRPLNWWKVSRVHRRTRSRISSTPTIRWRIVSATRLPGGNSTAKIVWTLRRGNRWPSVIRRGAQFRIRAGFLTMLSLNRYRR